MKIRCKILQIIKDTVWYGCISIGIIVALIMFGHSISILFSTGSEAVIEHFILGTIVFVLSFIVTAIGVSAVLAYNERLDDICKV